MAGSHQPAPRTRLDSGVEARILWEVGPVAGERILRCLWTPSNLLQTSYLDPQEGVRYAESAAYNLREALDTVVRDNPAGNGGLATVLDAWDPTRSLAGCQGLTNGRPELSSTRSLKDPVGDGRFQSVDYGSVFSRHRQEAQQALLASSSLGRGRERCPRLRAGG